MTWIKIIEPADAEGSLAEIYRRLGRQGRVDQILLAHSLRPHTLEGHMAVYRSILHHPRNTLNRALAEAIGVHVSRLNGCRYCVAHHSAALRAALADDDRCRQWLQALEDGVLDRVFDASQRAALEYAERLTVAPSGLGAVDVQALRACGWEDGQILEINQVAAYFAYANRTVLGLGVETEGEPLGE